MKIETHIIDATKIAKLISTDNIISSIEDGLDLLGNLYYHDFDKIIIHGKNITPDFFDFKNGIAGETLQKFSNYRIRWAKLWVTSQNIQARVLMTSFMKATQTNKLTL